MAFSTKNARSITIDGDVYHWKVRRTELVAFGGPEGVYYRERLSEGETVRPGRVAQLLLHGRALNSAREELEPESLSDPLQGRTRYRWMKLLQRELLLFEDCVGTTVELGSWSWGSDPQMSSGSLRAELRFGATSVFPEADHWEVVFCISGNLGKPAYADAFGFPFRGGEPLGVAQERCWIFHRAETWTSAGWQHWDGPGEWSYVTQPGSIFKLRQLRVLEWPFVHIELGRSEEESSSLRCGLQQLRSLDGDALSMPADPAERHLRWTDRAVTSSGAKQGSFDLSPFYCNADGAPMLAPGAYDTQVRLYTIRGPYDGSSQLSTPMAFEVSSS